MPESSPREFLSQTPSADTTSSAAPPDLGTPPPTNPAEAHRFRVGALHAKGGLGEVYRATDTELDRAVALKRIQERFHGDTASLQRFQREAAITARLEHPGIVPIYGLVQDDHGQPAYAMRFVEGQSLLEAIRAFHQTKPDFTSLAFRQLLQRFVTVCQTVAYAHSRFVIHRDLKPANILLGPYGETLVVDWGLAKELPSLRPDQSDKPPGTSSLPLTVNEEPTEEGLTRAGQILGTAAYMPPEQAKGLHDLMGPTADIYSLGAVLYELLAGIMPYRGLTSHDILSRLRRDQLPEQPRQVQPGVPSALGAIVRKAMALKPEDRYPTASALAKDAERWLADEPVSAWREPVRLRLRRWLRRHQTWAAVGVVLVVAAAVLTAVLAEANARWSEQQRVAVAAEQAQTEAQRQETERKRQEAESRRREAVAARDDARKVVELMSSEGQLQVLEKQEKLSREQTELLKALLTYNQRYVQEEARAESERARRARAYFAIGWMQDRLGYKAEAEPAYRQALKVRAELAEDFPTNAAHRLELANGHNNLGILLRALGKRTEAVAAYSQGLQVFAKLSEDFPTVPTYRQRLAHGHHNLANLLSDEGKREEAEAAHRQALKLRTKLVEEFPTVPDYRRELTLSHHCLAVLLRAKGMYAEAETAYRQANQEFAKLVEDFPTVPDHRHALASNYHDLAALMGGLGKNDEQEIAYRQAMRVFGKLVEDFPAVPTYRQGLAYSQTNLGELLSLKGMRVEAETAFRQALKVRTKLTEDFPAVPTYRHELAFTLGNLSDLLYTLGKRAEAETNYRQVLQMQAKLVEDFPAVTTYRRHLARSHHFLATLLTNVGKREEAEAAFRQALKLRTTLVEDSPREPEYRSDLGLSHGGLGTLLYAQGKLAEAETAYRQALQVQAKLVEDFPGIPSYRHELARTHNDMGLLRGTQGKAREAETDYRHSTQAFARLAEESPAVPDYRQDLARSHNNLGILLEAQGRRAEAEAAYRQALQVKTKLVEDFPAVPDHVLGLAGSCCNFGHFQRTDGKVQESLEWYGKAIAALQSVLNKEPRLVTARLFLRNSYWGRASSLDTLKQHAEAARDWQRVLEINDDPKSVHSFRVRWAVALVRAGDPTRAATMVEEWVKGNNVGVATLFDGARVLSLATAVRDDANQHEQHAVRAVALLRQAKEAGYFRVQTRVKGLDEDPDFASLRQREDFKQFRSELDRP